MTASDPARKNRWESWRVYFPSIFDIHKQKQVKSRIMNRLILESFTASDIAFVVNKAALMAAKGNLLIFTEVILKCISEVQSERMKSFNIPMRDDKIEEENSMFTLPKKVIAS